MNENEKEILLILQEEASEVIQAVSKVFRFGMESEWNGETNKEHLTEEIGDLLAMIEILTDWNIVSKHQVDLAKTAKIEKLKTWSGIFNDRT